MDPDATVYAVIDRRVGGPVHINNKSQGYIVGRRKYQNHYDFAGMDIS